MKLIELQGICRDYISGASQGQVVHALVEANLCVQRGEYVSILGPSGSGKSTLMHILGCLDQSTRGRYMLEGSDVSHLQVNEMARIRNRTIGFVFQRFHLLPRSSALENVAMPMRYARIKPAERRRLGAELLERVGLADRMQHLPAELSGGQQQRVAIARALAMKPRLLLADEPTGNLDSASGQSIMELLDELNAEGTTIMIVTHDESLASRTPRVIRMHDGRIVSDGRPSGALGPTSEPRALPD